MKTAKLLKRLYWRTMFKLAGISYDPEKIKIKKYVHNRMTIEDGNFEDPIIEIGQSGPFGYGLNIKEPPWPFGYGYNITEPKIPGEKYHHELVDIRKVSAFLDSLKDIYGGMAYRKMQEANKIFWKEISRGEEEVWSEGAFKKV